MAALKAFIVLMGVAGLAVVFYLVMKKVLGLKGDASFSFVNDLHKSIHLALLIMFIGLLLIGYVFEWVAIVGWLMRWGLFLFLLVMELVRVWMLWRFAGDRPRMLLSMSYVLFLLLLFPGVIWLVDNWVLG